MLLSPVFAATHVETSRRSTEQETAWPQLLDLLDLDVPLRSEVISPTLLGQVKIQDENSGGGVATWKVFDSLGQAHSLTHNPSDCFYTHLG